MRYWFVGQTILMGVLALCIGIIYLGSLLVAIMPGWLIGASVVLFILSVAFMDTAHEIGKNILGNKK